MTKAQTMADLAGDLATMQLNGPDMMVDDYEQYNNDRQEVVNISPGPEEPIEETEVEIRADDCMYHSPHHFVTNAPDIEQAARTR